MNPSEQASEHLRTIRTLMERATVYRAISGPSALVGGVLTLITGGVLLMKDASAQVTALNFTFIWLAVLVLVTLFNIWSLRRGAGSRGEPFVSAGMKHALKALLPPLAAGFALGLMHAGKGNPAQESSYAEVAAGWTLFYGLALIATGAFAPRSMVILGYACLVMGVGLFWLALGTTGFEDYKLALRIMIGCFGVLHLLYGLWVVFTGKKSPLDRLIA